MGVRREILFEWKDPQITGDSRTNRPRGESRFTIVLEMKAENGMLCSLWKEIRTEKSRI